MRKDEIRRNKLTARVIYSPKPNEIKDIDGKPQTGETIKFGTEKLAKLGVGVNNGIFLKRIVESKKVSKVLELGAGTGNSAFYLGYPECVDELKTIEGSSDLAEIASETLSRLDTNCEVINQHFDDALEDIDEKFGLIYIDGQHEKKATLHYYEKASNKLKEDGIIVFDDIYWSRDMNECWHELIQMEDLVYTIDVGWFGLGVFNPQKNRSTHFDLCSYLPRPIITTPWGWKRSGKK